MSVDDRISHIAVIVPVHDEEELLEECLASVDAAVARVSEAQVAVFVVLDACTDGSAAIAARHDVETVRVDAGNVGIARAAGVSAAMDRFGGVAPTSLWTAHTDADSVVPENWLTFQREAAEAGADVVVGTVRPDFRDLDDARRRAWLARYTPGVANGHVHGANLGMRAVTLLSAGGFEPVAEHEDVRIVERARSEGARVVASDRAGVRTSGRTQGRTPGGYARYLRDDLVPLAASAESIGADL